jgi:hypothetical protein
MMHRFSLVLRFFRGLKALYLLFKERDPLFRIIIDYRDLWFPVQFIPALFSLNKFFDCPFQEVVVCITAKRAGCNKRDPTL